MKSAEEIANEITNWLAKIGCALENSEEELLIGRIRAIQSDARESAIREAWQPNGQRRSLSTEARKMAKVAYNACFGGFGLSREAVLLGRELSGDPKWGGATIKGDVYSDGKIVGHDFGEVDYKFPRHDPILIAVIERLGKAANGEYADLRIEEIPSGTPYRIDEYDGRESVETAETYTWTVAP